jgi:ornithine cyclodeaminase/alanine dehydrogenase-like protein (mu-crystallin family)
MARAEVVVDSREACLAEAGDLVMAIAEGHLDPEISPAEIGEVLAGSRSGRAENSQLTLFKSVGNAVQDLAVAGLVLEEARRLELGTVVAL